MSIFSWLKRRNKDQPKPVTITCEGRATSAGSSLLIHLTARAWGQWTDATWGPRDHAGALNHLRDELDEIADSPEDVFEWADALALVIDGARLAGHSFGNLALAYSAKLEINKARKWAPLDARGVSQHLKGEGA